MLSKERYDVWRLLLFTSGSPYVDNEVFTMSFDRCPEISTSTSQSKQDHYLFISEDCPKTCTAKVYSKYYVSLEFDLEYL